MTKISNPHDKLFRSAMVDLRVAREFFEAWLPANLHDQVDFNSLQLCHNTYVDQSLKLSLSDVLYKVTIAGQMGYFYLLCEHQTNSDALRPFRIWQYIIGIWLDHLKQTNSKTLARASSWFRICSTSVKLRYKNRRNH